MSDLIIRKAAIDSIREMSPEFFSAYQHYAYVNRQEVMIRLMALPPAQLEQKKGKWIDIDAETYTWMIKCDKCGHLRSMMSTNKIYPKFCESCGAKMENE